MPSTLRPTAPIADRALLPGDPGRALLLAQALLTEPKMANHHRGLWGYTGMAADGAPLTVQATGMGGPSAAIVLADLAGLGVRRAVRVGTCGALDRALAPGDLLVAREALAADGTSRALGAGERLSADPQLTTALTGDAAGLVASADLLYDRPAGLEDGWRAAGALGTDLETAPLLAAGARYGVAVASVLVVVAAPGDAGPLGDDALETAAKRAGRAAQNALRSASG